MPVIHASDVSDDAAFMSVMDSPTLLGAATTKFGNNDTAVNATKNTAAIDCQNEGGQIVAHFRLSNRCRNTHDESDGKNHTRDQHARAN